MRVIQSACAEAAFVQALYDINDHHVETSSRNGPVWKFAEPVTTVYLNPKNFILRSALRNANPFFHMAEVAWMIGGYSDLDKIQPYNQRMATYSDDGQSLTGSAYGHRWANYFRYDQLKEAIEILQKTPDSRRVVLTHWDGFKDLQNQGSGDLPCNLQVLLWIEKGYLSMTVTNRSNDMVYGCYGSNVVHFSCLQIILALALGVEVGSYWQVSNNLHIYLENPVAKRMLDAAKNFKLEVSAGDFPETFGLRVEPESLRGVEFLNACRQDARIIMENYGEDIYAYDLQTEFFKPINAMTQAWQEWKRYRPDDNTRKAVLSLATSRMNVYEQPALFGAGREYFERAVDSKAEKSNG